MEAASSFKDLLFKEVSLVQGKRETTRGRVYLIEKRGDQSRWTRLLGVRYPFSHTSIKLKPTDETERENAFDADKNDYPLSEPENLCSTATEIC